MSTQQLPQVVKWRSAVCDSDMTPNRRFILLALSVHMNGDGRCWPSLARLTKITGLHRATVIRNLNAAESEGWIARKPGGPNLRAGENKATEYTAQIPLPLVATPSRTGGAEDPLKVSTTTSVLGRPCDPNKKSLNLNLSQVLGVAPKRDATPTDDELEREIERDEQRRSQERASKGEAPPPSTAERSGSSTSEPSSLGADSDLSKGDPPPPGYFDEVRRRLEKVSG